MAIRSVITGWNGCKVSILQTDRRMTLRIPLGPWSKKMHPQIEVFIEENMGSSCEKSMLCCRAATIGLSARISTPFPWFLRIRNRKMGNVKGAQAISELQPKIWLLYVFRSLLMCSLSLNESQGSCNIDKGCEYLHYWSSLIFLVSFGEPCPRIYLLVSTLCVVTRYTAAYQTCE